MQVEMDQMEQNLVKYEGEANEMLVELATVKEQWEEERESLAADLWVVST